MRQSGTAFLNVAAPEQMQAFGRRLGTAIEAAQAAEFAFIIGLEGELGAGKTTLVGGILRAWGIAGPIRSPTYTLIEPYEADGKHIYHLDLYRLVDAGEIEPLGIRDLLEPGAVLLIEWPARALGALPGFDLTVDIDYPVAPATGRDVTLTAHSPFGANAVRRIVAAIPEMRLLSS